MPHPVIHAEIRSADPDATREFFGKLFGWTYSDGAFPGYTFVDVGVDGAPATAIGPLQGGEDSALFFVGVDDVAATLAQARSSAVASSNRCRRFQATRSESWPMPTATWSASPPRNAGSA